MNESKANQNNDMKNFKDELEHVMERVEEINEKMYDFEANKRNNLIFYGLPADHEETPESLALSVQRLLKEKMLLKREMIITQVHTLCQ